MVNNFLGWCMKENKVLSQEDAKKIFLPIIEEKGKEYKKKINIKARPAKKGEVIVTYTSDGKETSNKAKKGDYVVTNLTSSKEQYILDKETFEKRYEKIKDLEDGEALYKALGKCRAIKFIPKDLDLKDEIYFIASWGEEMVLKKGDMVVTSNGKEVYRIAKKEFGESYEEIEDDKDKEEKDEE